MATFLVRRCIVTSSYAFQEKIANTVENVSSKISQDKLDVLKDKIVYDRYSNKRIISIDSSFHKDPPKWLQEASLMIPTTQEKYIEYVALSGIPGPRPWTFASDIIKKLPVLSVQLTASIMNFFQRLSADKGEKNIWNIRPYNFLFDRYGDIVHLRGFLGGNIILLRKPEHFQIILQKEGHNTKRVNFESLENYHQYVIDFRPTDVEAEEVATILIENSLQVRAFDELVAAADELVNRLRTTSKLHLDVPPDFYIDLCKWGLTCHHRVLFRESVSFLSSTNIRYGSMGNKMFSAFIEASDALRKCESGFHFWQFFKTSSWYRLSSACTVLYGMFIKQMQQEELYLLKNKHFGDNKSTQSLAGVILKSQYSPNQVLSDLIETTLIGVNVAAYSMGFLLYNLAKTPRVQTKLFEELEAVFTSKNYDMQIEDFNKLPYLKACLKENLRMYPPIPYTVRYMKKGVKVSDYFIPKGTYILLCYETACQNKTTYHDPDHFYPERWLREAQTVDPFTIIPFGFGSCNYLTHNLLEKQLGILTAKIIRNFWVNYTFEDIKTDGRMLAMPTLPFRFSFDDRQNN